MILAVVYSFLIVAIPFCVAALMLSLLAQAFSQSFDPDHPGNQYLYNGEYLTRIEIAERKEKERRSV